MAKTVLIVIDVSRRELFGCSLLKRCLEALGIRTIVCSRYAFGDYYARYVPDAVVWPNACLNFGEVSTGSYVFVLPSESGNGQPDQVRATHGGTPTNPIYPGAVDRFFCWGPAMKEILLENRKWRAEQLAVTGSPSTDHWLLPHPAIKPSDFRIGFTTSFRVLCNSAPPGKMDYFEFIDQAEMYGADGTYYRPPEHAESWVFFEASLARVLAGLARTLSEQRFGTIELRPHPGHREGGYRYFQTLSNGQVSITKGGTISEWLNHISILFTFISASALDAVVRGVPVVSLRGLLDPDALRKIPSDFRYTYDEMLWQLEDFGQAVDYAEKAAKGELKPCGDEKGFAGFMAQHFAFPRKQLAAQQVALEIKKVLDGEGIRRIGPGRKGPDRLQGLRRIKKMIRRHVPLFPQFMAFCRYLRGLWPGRQDIGFSYRPWRIRERSAAMRTTDEVISSNGLMKGFLA